MPAIKRKQEFCNRAEERNKAMQTSVFPPPVYVMRHQKQPVTQERKGGSERRRNKGKKGIKKRKNRPW